MQYQVNMDGKPHPEQVWHPTRNDAIQFCQDQFYAWGQSGASRRPVFSVHYDGKLVWDSENGTNKPAHYVNQLNEMGVTRPLSRAIRVF